MLEESPRPRRIKLHASGGINHPERVSLQVGSEPHGAWGRRARAVQRARRSPGVLGELRPHAQGSVEPLHGPHRAPGAAAALVLWPLADSWRTPGPRSPPITTKRRCPTLAMERIGVSAQGASPAGRRQPWSALLRGIAGIASVDGGTAQPEALGTRIVPAHNVRRLLVHL